MSKPLVFKVSLIGSVAVGKTSIFVRLKDDRFVEKMSTLAMDRGKIDFSVNGKAVQIDLWDTAGSERFWSTSNNYLRGSKAVVYVYDVTDSSTLYGLGAWLQEVEKSVGREDHHCFLVGNKIDLQEDIDVEKKTAESFLKEKDFVQLFEVSAKSGAGVRSAFQAIAEHLVKTYTPSNKNQTLEEGTAPRISRGACCQ